MKLATILRIEEKIVFAGPTECWRWKGCLSRRYAQVWLDGRMQQASRVVYRLCVGPIPDGYDVDHVTKRGCRFKDCVNPAHLEAVTRAVNLERDPGRRVGSRNLTHCSEGHEYTEENTYRYADGRVACRICRRAWGEKYRRKQGAAKRVFRAR